MAPQDDSKVKRQVDKETKEIEMLADTDDPSALRNELIGILKTLHERDLGIIDEALKRFKTIEDRVSGIVGILLSTIVGFSEAINGRKLTEEELAVIAVPFMELGVEFDTVKKIARGNSFQKLFKKQPSGTSH